MEQENKEQGRGRGRVVCDKDKYVEQFVHNQKSEAWLSYQQKNYLFYSSLWCNYANSELLETLFKQISLFRKIALVGLILSPCGECIFFYWMPAHIPWE